MPGRLSHIAIAVPDLAAAIRPYALLGASLSAPQDLPQHGVRVVFISLGNSRIELMEPLGPQSAIAGFLARHPSGGMHHLCLEVADIVAARDRLRANGLRILGSGEPKNGAQGKPVLFVHPADCNGTLIELEQA